MTPSQPTITLTLTAQEEQHFIALMDAALRHGGAAILDVALLFRGKILAAHQEQAAAGQRKPLAVAAAE